MQHAAEQAARDLASASGRQDRTESVAKLMVGDMEHLLRDISGLARREASRRTEWHRGLVTAWVGSLGSTASQTAGVQAARDLENRTESIAKLTTEQSATGNDPAALAALQTAREQAMEKAARESPPRQTIRRRASSNACDAWSSSMWMRWTRRRELTSPCGRGTPKSLGRLRASRSAS